jgi:hypothetical protein
MKRAREIGTVLAATATLLGAVAEFYRSRVDAATTYQNTALSMGDTAASVQELRGELLERIDKVEKACGVGR